jgi:hypothetical protein
MDVTLDAVGIENIAVDELGRICHLIRGTWRNSEEARIKRFLP